MFIVIRCLKPPFLKSAASSQERSQGLAQREAPWCPYFLNSNHDLVWQVIYKFFLGVWAKRWAFQEHFNFLRLHEMDSLESGLVLKYLRVLIPYPERK